MKKLILGFTLALSLLLSVVSFAANKRAVTLEGQVVCSVCWDEADRKTTPYGDDKDIQCAIRCAKRNIPQALAVMGESSATLYVLEPGKVKGKEWVDLIGKFVKITGTVRDAGEKKFLKVDALEKLAAKEN